MRITLDIAAVMGACFALLAALIWPLVLLIILLYYRRDIPGVVQGLTRRVTKLEFAGISVDLAVAKQFTPDWTAGALDLRHTATSVEVNDSTARTFATQLQEEGTADFAIVDLHTGQEWLTTRLYIMAILFARVKGITCFVFLETAGEVRKRYIGWAEPDRIRWRLARRYPWLETAYADAYSAVMNQMNSVVVSNRGRIGYEWNSNDFAPSLQLLREFLQRVQAAPPIPLDTNEWVPLESTPQTYEHAEWISAGLAESLLGSDCHRQAIRSRDLKLRARPEQLKLFLAEAERFVGVVEDDRRFEYLVNRGILLDQVAKTISMMPNADSD